MLRRDFIRLAAGAGAAAALDLTGLPRAEARPKPPFPELTLRGSAGAIGRAHGKALASQIKDNVGFYLRWLARITKRDHASLLRIAGGFAAPLRAHAPHIYEEIKGIAAGSRRTLAELLLVNARTDMLVLARRRKGKGKRAPQRRRASASPGCTALALVGAGRGGARIALGQNWDWRADLIGHTAVLRVARRGGLPLVTFSEAGMVGKIGMNRRKVGVCLNFLDHKDDANVTQFGLPVHVLLRLVMEQPDLDSAVRLVERAKRCASANFLIAEHQKRGPRAVDLEWTSKRVAKLWLSGDALVHTNHYLAKGMRSGCSSQRSRSTNNRYKQARVRARATQKQRDPVARMQKILADRAGAPYSVSKSSAKDSRSQTLAGVIMDLSNNALSLSSGPPHLNTFGWRPGA